MKPHVFTKAVVRKVLAKGEGMEIKLNVSHSMYSPYNIISVKYYVYNNDQSLIHHIVTQKSLTFDGIVMSHRWFLFHNESSGNVTDCSVSHSQEKG